MTGTDDPTVEIALDGVALRQHDEPYPFDYRPYAHQRRLAGLIGGDNGFVAVNDSPTGGGKTSSWLAPAFAEQLDTIAVYPTNALVLDQREQIERELNAVSHDVSVCAVTAERLASRRSDLGVQSNGEALERLYRLERRKNDQVILLMNPDIFVMLCRGLYRTASREYRRIPLVVVDEFHRAGLKERNTLQYLLDELYERDDRRYRLNKIVLLSATPDEQQERQLDHAMAAPYHRVTSDSSDERRSFRDGVENGWRAVMPPVDLDVRVAPTFGTADVLLQDDAEELLSFCRGTGRLAIILDGIHEVHRVTQRLSDELDRRVERIDGFHGDNKAEKLREFEVLVSNSAVEVGIDFDIDRLLFAGHNEASFLQRLGRLRSKEKRCRARCYVPRSIARELATDDRVTGQQSLTRAELDEVLDSTYPNQRHPTTFGWRYSAPETLEHLDDRLSNTTSDERERIARAGQRRIKRHFLDGTGVSLSDQDLQRRKEAIDWRVLRSLQWYRGDSIQALVYDRTEKAVRAYDVFYLLRYGDVTFYPQEKFEAMVPDGEADTVSRLEQYVDGFCTFDGTIRTTEEGWGRSVSFTGPRLANWLADEPRDRNRTPRVLDGLTLSVSPSDDSQPRVRTLDLLNQRLKTRRDRLGEEAGILCYPITCSPNMAQELYGLDDFFFLYPVAIQDEQASLALGTDALYLHCHVMERMERKRDDDLLGGVS